MKRFHLALTVLALALAVGLPAAQAQISNPLKKANKTKTSDDAAKSALPEYKGVKHALGVLDFENQGGFFTQWTLGDNLRLMLESSLYASKRFIIVERGELGAVVAEQDLQASGRAGGAATVAQTGKIRSARFLAAGAITEASSETSGEGGGINIRGLRLGAGGSKSMMVVVVKLIDTTSGEVVASERIRGEAGKSGIKIGLSGSSGSGSFGAFAKTPLAEAAQDCVDQAVKFIATKMESYAVEGSVVATTGDQIIIGMGENFGIQVGQKFIVRKDGEVLTDPATGAVLDRLEGEVTATIEVTRVREKTAYCKLLDGTMPERGETAVLQD